MINELDGKKKKNEQPPPPNDKVELPPNILNMLYVPGAGSYPSRSELLFAFLTAALRARVSPAVILAGCLDSRYASGGIYQHVEENGQIDGSAFREFGQEQSLTLNMAHPLPRLL